MGYDSQLYIVITLLLRHHYVDLIDTRTVPGPLISAQRISFVDANLTSSIISLVLYSWQSGTYDVYFRIEK
jgi:hypothetical protein